LLCQL